MKKYVSPSASITELEITDIITISAPDDLADYDDVATAPGTWFN